MTPDLKFDPRLSFELKKIWGQKKSGIPYFQSPKISVPTIFDLDFQNSAYFNLEFRFQTEPKNPENTEIFRKLLHIKICLKA